MAARDRWTEDLVCRRCGKTGKAKISEVDHPWVRGDWDRTVDECPSGFLVVGCKSNSRHPQIICAECKTIVFGPR
jgi:hypothetical protein